jgi:hypothetical protein
MRLVLDKEWVGEKAFKPRRKSPTYRGLQET